MASDHRVLIVLIFAGIAAFFVIVILLVNHFRRKKQKFEEEEEEEEDDLDEVGTDEYGSADLKRYAEPTVFFYILSRRKESDESFKGLPYEFKLIGKYDSSSKLREGQIVRQDKIYELINFANLKDKMEFKNTNDNYELVSYDDEL